MTSLEIGYHQARILIVDDERQNRDLLGVMLAPEGFDVRSAVSGEEALAMVATEPPDLILLDVMMPEMDGYQVAAKLKGSLATKNIPVILVTALSDRFARMVGLTAGAEDLLTKPVDRAELCVRVRNLLRLKAYGDYYDKYSRRLEGEAVSRTAHLLERTKQAAVLAEQAALLDLAQAAIVVRDMHGRILFWNRGAEVMYGWLSSEAVGRNAIELLRTELSEPTLDHEAELLRIGHWEGEAIRHTRDGTRLIVASRWTVQRQADGLPVRILTIDDDITDRIDADSELLLLTERLSLATAVAKVGVWEWDLASNTLTWDATMFAIYGFRPVVPMPYERWSTSVHGEDLAAVEAALRNTIAEKGQGSAEYRIVRPDGSTRNVSSVERAALDERGNVSRLIGVNMDITERKEAEKALEQTRQDQIQFKDDFLSHVSHELRSPLTAIKQFTTICLGGLAGELNPEQRQYQEIVLKNIHQLQSMIDDLLEVTRLETGKLTLELDSVSVANAVTDVVNTLKGSAGAKGIALSCALPADLPTVYADQTRLRQILIILLDNAIKFTPQGGTVTIQAGRPPGDSQVVLLEVSDTGCGISGDMTESIFQRLYQGPESTEAGRRGLGLGLYICKELVMRQGGSIWAKGRPPEAGTGSIFSVTLPVFSLHNLIAPLLNNDKWPAESVALITVQASLPASALSRESQETWSNEARGLIQRCLLPDLDVLLPTTSSGAEAGRFLVAVFADERGTSVLANRIREQFERLPPFKQTGLSYAVSYAMLAPVPHEEGNSADRIVARMAIHLEESIDSQRILEAVS